MKRWLVCFAIGCMVFVPIIAVAAANSSTDKLIDEAFSEVYSTPVLGFEIIESYEHNGVVIRESNTAFAFDIATGDVIESQIEDVVAGNGWHEFDLGDVYNIDMTSQQSIVRSVLDYYDINLRGDWEKYSGGYRKEPSSVPDLDFIAYQGNTCFTTWDTGRVHFVTQSFSNDSNTYQVLVSFNLRDSVEQYKNDFIPSCECGCSGRSDNCDMECCN